MKLALEQLADNPIIDELVYLPLHSRRITSLRACSVMFRKPFIEVTLADGEVIQRHFQRPSFAESWAEASVASRKRVERTIGRSPVIRDNRLV